MASNICANNLVLYLPLPPQKQLMDYSESTCKPCVTKHCLKQKHIVGQEYNDSGHLITQHASQTYAIFIYSMLCCFIVCVHWWNKALCKKIRQGVRLTDRCFVSWLHSRHPNLLYSHLNTNVSHVKVTKIRCAELATRHPLWDWEVFYVVMSPVV